MFQLDDSFLQELGLNELPSEQRKPFLDHIYNELELRVGERLSQGMSDSQLEEFSDIIDKKPEAVDDFLMKNAPDYQSDPMYKKIMQSMNLSDDNPQVKEEYVPTKWLEINRPNYREVVSAVMEELKDEISADKEAILGSL